MTLKPHTDECTTFENVRLMKVGEKDLEITVSRGNQLVEFKNSKPVKIFYRTDDGKVMNTLQVIHLVSDENIKLKVRFDELVAHSDIQDIIKKWILSTYQEA